VRVCAFNEKDREFIRKCRRWVGATLLVYLSLNMAMRKDPPGLTGQVIAGLAGFSFFMLLLLTGLIIARSGDEFRRALLLRSFLWACVGTMLVASVWGFMELFAKDAAPHMPVLLIPALLVVLTAVAKLIAFRRPTAEPEGLTA
jgi:cytochrome bd-type quinol oxidase subunit 2